MGSCVLVADSWLSVDGKVAGWELHLARFLAGVSSVGADIAEAELVMLGLRADTPKSGAFFPRVALTDTGFVATVRDAPARLTTAVLKTADTDPRKCPAIKGPDLEELGLLRASVAESGANEAIILTENCEIIDGAYSAVCWWRGDVLCAPPAELIRTDSVTWKLVQQIAKSRGVKIVQETAKPADLAGCEVWILSALHGIRYVTEWVLGSELKINQARRDTWQTEWESLRK